MAKGVKGLKGLKHTHKENTFHVYPPEKTAGGFHATSVYSNTIRLHYVVLSECL